MLDSDRITFLLEERASVTASTRERFSVVRHSNGVYVCHGCHAARFGELTCEHIRFANEQYASDAVPGSVRAFDNESIWSGMPYIPLTEEARFLPPAEMNPVSSLDLYAKRRIRLGEDDIPSNSDTDVQGEK